MSAITHKNYPWHRTLSLMSDMTYYERHLSYNLFDKFSPVRKLSCDNFINYQPVPFQICYPKLIIVVALMKIFQDLLLNE